MAIFLWIAAGISGIAFYIHTFIGGRRIARPLLDNETLYPASKWLNYYCWHIATMLIVLLGVTFTVLPFVEHRMPLIIFIAVLTCSAALLSAIIERKAGARFMAFPPTQLFTAITACCLLTIFT